MVETSYAGLLIQTEGHVVTVQGDGEQKEQIKPQGNRSGN
jgi:hypothetical protein